jgi:hypothetical protein
LPQRKPLAAELIDKSRRPGQAETPRAANRLVYKKPSNCSFDNDYYEVFVLFQFSGVGMNEQAEIKFFNPASLFSVLACLAVSGCGTPSITPAPFAQTVTLPAVNGEWVKDSRTGCNIWVDTPLSIEKTSWSGACPGGKASGNGNLLRTVDGRRVREYDGDFVEGKMHGQGKQFWFMWWDFNSANGYRIEGGYVGSWKDGKMNGQGKFVWPDKSYYEGNWVAGKKQGQGIYVPSSGYAQKGNFSDDKYAPIRYVYTPLQLGILGKNVKGVSELLSKGASVTERGNSDKYPITLAFESNFWVPQDMRGNAEFIYSDIYGALVRAKLQEIKGNSKMIVTSLDFPDDEAISRSRKTPLSSEQNRIIELLLDAGAKLQADSQKSGEFVSSAMANKNTPLLKKLVRAGLDVNTNSGGKHLLEFAVANNDIDFSNQLVGKGANVNFKTTRDDNLVFLAVNDGHAEIARIILKKGVKLPDIFSAANSALKNWNFSEYSVWLNRGSVLGLLNANQKSQLEAIRLKENGLYLADKSRRAEQEALAAREESQRAQRQQSSASSSSPGSSYCSTSDTCFETVSTRGDEVTIKCTKGMSAGQTKTLHGPNSSGKWAYGSLGGYHRGFREAGNFGCE